MKSLYFKTAKDWETWLVQNHQKESEIKLIYYKKHTKKPCITYDESVKIALCYGWIDSLVNRIDEECYTRKFSVRKSNSVWSELNKKRVAELIDAGKMQAAGMRLVDIAKQNGKWDEVIEPPKTNLEISADFKAALDENAIVKGFFQSLTKAQKNQFIRWINVAKRQGTKEKRIQESIELLANKKTLGLK
ncbi:YdeI/OmpD-associated family protein [uncultured Draconibacterium sp.]|uniref:YdeI/OmpD-associated family protein n=1 Tax=uncultured Draconibacterium sp. TaxID=1573823 RepID=UPI0025E905F6|nr:YdeI/OmpD-associated family protein [uncultured Draconibacterium sp.]